MEGVSVVEVTGVVEVVVIEGSVVELPAGPVSFLVPILLLAAPVAVVSGGIEVAPLVAVIGADVFVSIFTLDVVPHLTVSVEVIVGDV